MPLRGGDEMDTTVPVFMVVPVHKACHQQSLIVSGIVNGCGFSRVIRCLGLIRKFSSNSR